MSALRCVWCAMASGDQPSLYGDLKPGLRFLSGCTSWTAFRIIYAQSVYLNLFIGSMDAVMAFLNATLKENVYIDPPPPAGYPPVAKGLVLKLDKALYGLKQSPKEWNETLDNFLREDLRMTRLKTEQCIYVRFSEDWSEYIIQAVYVDDLVIDVKRRKWSSDSRSRQNWNARTWGSLSQSYRGRGSISITVAVCQGCAREVQRVLTSEGVQV